ncbi:protein phosphatase [Streptomyces sp. NPDC059819]|uniref:protein-tyrosine phosphatase family protein n=1 Tax=Streptomyces sp. NPDC059819 TaxID=3346963 RepID=UPI003658EF31
MKTRHKNRDTPDPEAASNEIVPGLWMGGHYWVDGRVKPRQPVVGGEFDLVISLFSRPDHGPGPDVDHRVAEIPDAPLTCAQLSTVQQLAQDAAHAVSSGHRTLIRCNAGFNRSGLLMGQTLIELGYAPTAAIDLIRQHRSPWALNNRTFEEYLITGLDIARFLTGLDTSS